MPRPARSKAEVARTREAILDAAARAFAVGGFAGITMDDLAREAGYSTASLYNYFSSKDAVLQALLERSLQSMLRAVDGPVPLGLSPEQCLEVVVLRLLEEARDHHWLTSLIMSDALTSDQADPGSMAAAYMAVHERFMQALVARVSTIEWLPADQAPRLAFHLVSAIRTENFLWLDGGPPDELPPLAHQLVAFWTAGSRALLELT